MIFVHVLDCSMFTRILLILSAYHSFLVVSQQMVIRGFSTIRNEHDEALVPIATQGLMSLLLIRFFLTNPYLPSGLFHPYKLDKSIFNFRGVWCTFSFYL